MRYDVGSIPDVRPPPTSRNQQKDPVAEKAVARSLRTQQRAQTTHRPQFVFHPGKPEVLTLKPTDDQLIDVPP